MLDDHRRALIGCLAIEHELTHMWIRCSLNVDWSPVVEDDLKVIRQTLMTAWRLFSNNLLGSAFDYKTGINFSFEALQDLASMHDIRKDLRVRFGNIVNTTGRTAHRLHVPQVACTVASFNDLDVDPE
jgi:hypothetical protein